MISILKKQMGRQESHECAIDLRRGGAQNRRAGERKKKARAERTKERNFFISSLPRGVFFFFFSTRPFYVHACEIKKNPICVKIVMVVG